MLVAEQVTDPYLDEPREFQRVDVKIHGRYMLEDRSEHPCEVVNMSPGDALVLAEDRGTVGERVIMYLEHLGRVEGTISRELRDGFAMKLNVSEHKREKLAAQLTWITNKHELNLPEDRRHERQPPANTQSSIKLSDGREYTCRIIDLSLSGAAVEIDVRPAIGTEATLGTMHGRVVRHFDEGIAIEFSTVQRSESLQFAFGSRDR